jgi:Flp pilus assembly protein TadG
MSNQLDGSPADKSRSCAGDPTGTGITRSFAIRLRSLLRCKRGVAAVEFGLGAPLLIGMLLPVADLGIAFSMQQQLRQAVQAGAQYATSYPWNQNSPAAIANAVIAATPLSDITSRICRCPTASPAGTGGGTSDAACATLCPQNQTAGSYVVVLAERPYTPILPYSLLGDSTTLSAKSIVRIQ